MYPRRSTKNSSLTADIKYRRPEALNAKWLGEVRKVRRAIALLAVGPEAPHVPANIDRLFAVSMRMQWLPVSAIARRRVGPWYAAEVGLLILAVVGPITSPEQPTIPLPATPATIPVVMDTEYTMWTLASHT